jgi:hypothetical protein
MNAASAREKSTRHGHPSTLHLWWPRQPLAAARAVIVDEARSAPRLLSYVKLRSAGPATCGAPGVTGSCSARPTAASSKTADHHATPNPNA